MSESLYLADLTHTGQLVASNTHPYGVGLIAAYLTHRFGPKIRIELFKYPEDLAQALETRPPRVIGFANYSWNCNLSYEFARRVKKRSPGTVVVFGGPNYGLVHEEQVEFWRRYPLMDFYVLKEGEVAMEELLKSLESFNYDLSALKESNTVIPSCHYMKDGSLVAGPLLPRLDLEKVPSPYPAGLMDKFFDNVLIPMTSTTRGCPFKCSFCTEGTSYYNKVSKRSALDEDLEYMAQRIGTIQDLILTNANFGMFPEDLEHARTIAEIQKKYGWPKHIHVSGGKNKKEQLLEVASIVGGAMNVAASLQSTDKTVLDNVRRSNISLEQLNHVGAKGSRIDANTYTELILGLPGDSLRAHTQSLRDSVNAGLGFVRMYQLILLLETDMNTPETRRRFGMKTKFRVMPRCFGVYKLFGEEFVSVETEEISVSQDSLSFEDYVECRELDLTVEITHNVNMFRELYGLARFFSFSWFDFLLRVHDRRREYPALKELYDTFREDTVKPLRDSRDDLEAFAKSNVNRYILDELGTNELFKGKAVAFFKLQEPLHDALYSEMESLLSEKGHLDGTMALYLKEAREFSKSRKMDLLNESLEFEGGYSFDFEEVMKRGCEVDPREFHLDVPAHFRFYHTKEQKKMIQGYIYQYGTTTVGLGRIMLRAHVKRLFRAFEAQGVPVEKTAEDTYRRALNLYGD